MPKWFCLGQKWEILSILKIFPHLRHLLTSRYQSRFHRLLNIFEAGNEPWSDLLSINKNAGSAANAHLKP